MSTVLRSLKILVGADVSKAQSALNNLGKDFQKAGKSMVKTGTNLTKSITVPIVGAAVAAVKFASDLEESVNKVDVAFAESADKVKRWSETTLKSFGIAQGTALDMAATFGDMGTAMGQLPSTAADMSTALAGLAGDLASFKNIGLEQAATALKGVYTGEGEALKTLGIVMQDNTLIAYAQAEGYKKSYKEMTQAEKVALRYSYVMDATKNAQGDFARTSDGVANQTRIVQESLKQAAASMGTILLPKVAEVLQAVNGWIEKFQNLDGSTKENIVKIGLFAAAIGPAVTIIGKLTGAAGSMAKALANVAGAASKGTLSLTTLLGPQGVAVLAVAAIAGLVYALQSWAREAKEASKETDKLLETTAASKAAFSDNLDEIEDNAAASKELADELNRLNGIESKSNAEKEQMSTIIRQLNEQMPELNLSIDEQTGLLSENIDSVYELIDAKREQLRVAALEERIVENMKEQNAVARELTQQEERLAAATAKTFENVVKGIGLKGSWQRYNELKEASENVDALTKSEQELAEEQEALWKELEQYSGKVEESNKVIAESTTEMVEEVEFAHESLKSVYTDYHRAYEDAKERHIADMGALDDEGIQKTELTAKKIKANLEKQIEDFRNWRTSIADLASRVPDDVMQELYELGPSFAPVIAELNGMTQEKLNEWIAVWQEKSKLATDAARKEVGGLTDWMRKAGWESGNAFAIGLANAIDEIKAAAKRATRAGSIGPVTYSTSSLGKLSTTVGMKAYAHGTDYVPETGPAILHKGEAVLTASENRAGRGITININGPISSESDAERYGQSIVRSLRQAGVTV